MGDLKVKTAGKPVAETDAAIPAYIDGASIDASMLDIDAGDLQMSALSLVQGRHPAKKNDDTLKDGDYVDMMTGKNHGPQVQVIIVKHQKTWSKRNLGNDYRDDRSFSIDGECWNDSTPMTDDEKFRCLEHNFFILLAKEMQPVPMKIKFKKTSSRAGRNLLNLLHREVKSGRPMHAKTYTLSSEPQNINGNDVFVISVAPSGFCPEEHYFLADSVSKSIRSVEIKSDTDSSGIKLD